MSICRVAMLAYIWDDVPRYDGKRQLWSDSDLRDMVQWCRDMINEGLDKEPHDQFSLRGFITWATRQIEGVKCDYRQRERSAIGVMVKDRWTCNNHLSK